MRTALLVCGFAILYSHASGVEITVGPTRLSIPAPPDFGLLTADMKPYADFVQRFVPPSNAQFAVFLANADLALAAQGQIPQADRKFCVQTAKGIIEPFVGAGDFAELKRVIKSQNESLLKKVEAQMPDFLQKVNQGLTKDYEVDLGLSLTQMVPLPVHYETDRCLAYSMFVRMAAKDGGGHPTEYEGVVTATFVHLRGKVLFLYVNAEKAGLAWSREQARSWADAIIAANPSVGEVARRERSERHFGFIGSGVGRAAVVGAVVGGIIGLLGYVFRKRNG